MRKRDLIKKTFAKYIDEDVLERVLNGLQEASHLETKKIEFVLVLVDDTDSKECPSIIRAAVAIIDKYEGMVDSIVGPLIVVLFGAPVAQPGSESKRKALVQAITKAIGEKVSMVHGHSECLVGTVGNESRMSYTALIPGFKEILRRLSGLPYGGVLEI
jgi:hypothetical protein